MTNDDLAEQARGLRDDVVSLAESVTVLAGRTAQSERTVARMRRVTIALVVVMVVGAISTGYLVVLGQRINALTQCQTQYNAINNERTRALTEVTAREREADRARSDALDAVFLDPSLLKPAAQRTPQDARRVRQLFADYLDAVADLKVERAAADKARAEHPVPPPPAAVCGA